MEPRWRWQPLGAPNPSARTSDLSAGWVQPYSWRSEGGETNLRDLRWHRAKGPAKVHWAGILWAYHVGRRLEPCEVWMSRALASSPWLVVLLYLESTGSTEPARDPKLPEAVGLRALARARRWQAPLGFLNENGRHGLQLSASFQVALAQNIAETGRLAAAIHLAKAAAAAEAEAEEGSIASLRRPLRQLCSTCFESRWRLGLGLLTDLRLLRLRGRPGGPRLAAASLAAPSCIFLVASRGEVVLPTSRALDSNWREAGVFPCSRASERHLIMLSFSSGPHPAWDLRRHMAATDGEERLRRHFCNQGLRQRVGPVWSRVRQRRPVRGVSQRSRRSTLLERTV